MNSTYFGIPFPTRHWLAYFMCLLAGIIIDALRFMTDMSFGADLVFIVAKCFLLMFAANLIINVRHEKALREAAKKMDMPIEEARDIIEESEALRRNAHFASFAHFVMLTLLTSIAGMFVSFQLTKFLA